MSDIFVHLEDRHEGDYSGFEKRFSQDMDDFNGVFTTSGFIPITAISGYIFAWRENVVSATGAGLIRLHLYDSGYNVISGYESIDLPFSESTTSGWVRRTVRLKPELDDVYGGEDYLLPSGIAYTKVSVLMPAEAPSGVEVYVNGLDLVQSNTYMIYTSSNEEVTAVEFSGLNNGYYQFNNPILRDSYEFIGQRKWTAPDATKGPGSFLTFEDNAAANNVEYSYVIDAFDVNGNKSELSDKKTIMAGDIYAPAQVSGLLVSAAPEAATLSWTCPADPDYSHVNIYSNISLTTLIKSELGVPGQNDSTIVSNLTAGVTYNFWVTAVDKYGNENTVAVPSGSCVPDSFSETNTLEIRFAGDDYVKQETQNLSVFSRLALSAPPTLVAKDSANNNITTSSPVLSISETDYYVWTGTLTVSAGNSEGQARVLASGLTISGTIALSENKIFTIDKTAPTLSAAMINYNYVTGTKRFYNADTSPRFSISLSDAVGANGYAYKINSATDYAFKTYQSGLTTSEALLFDQEGVNTVSIKAYDVAGNVSTETTITGYKDSRPPVISISGIAGNSQFLPWYNSSTMQVKFNAKEDETAGAANVAGISGVYWRYAYNHAPTTESWTFTAGGDPTVTVPTTGTIPTNTAAVHLEYYAVDNASNKSTNKVDIINIDAVAPRFTTGLWGNCHSVPGGFHLLWNIASIVDDAPSSGFKQLVIYRADNIALTSPVEVTTIPISTNSRSFVDMSSDLEYYRTYWWYMKVEDNAGNVSSGSPVVSGIIDHNIKGIFKNLIGNGSFERVQNYDGNSPVGWTKVGSPTIQTNSGYHGIKYAAITKDNYYFIENFPLINAKVNKRYVLSLRAKKLNSSSATGASVTIKFYDANKDLITVSGTQTVTFNTSLVPYASWGQLSVPVGNSPAVSGINPPNSAGIVTALSCDIIISGTHLTDNLFIDAVQLEEPALNTTVDGSEYVDSYNITGDILQGQRIIGNQIEANTISAEHLTIGVHGGNFIDNSSFELLNYDDTVPAYWNFVAPSPTIVTASPHTGLRCVKLAGVGSTIYMDSYGGYITNPLPASGNNYCFSFYARSDGGTANLGITFQWRGPTHSVLGTSTKAITVSATEWTRYFVTIGTGLDVTPAAGTASCALAIGIASAGAGCFIDSLQWEAGTQPTLFTFAGVTEIDGGTIKTGRVQSVDEQTYFDLDASQIRTTNTAGDFTVINAGSMQTFDVASQKQTVIVSGTVTNTNNVTGDYSRLTEGSLQFYNALAGITTNYGQQIIYINPSEINCGTQFVFEHPYSVQAPFVVPIANRIQVYSSANSATNQYLGFDMTNITTTGFLPRAYLYAGGLPGTTTINQASIGDQTMIVATDSITYASSDAKDENHGGSSVTAVNVTIRTRNSTATNNIITNRYTIRVRANATWDNAAAEQTVTKSVNTLKLSSDWVYSTHQFVGLTSGAKSVKVDWFYQSNSDICASELYRIEYINSPATIELTGSGLVGALVVGRSI